MKKIYVAFMLSVVVAVVALFSPNVISLSDLLLPVILCALIVISSGLILQKVDELSAKIDISSKCQCSCQKMNEHEQ